jgi:hypothetical protein
MLQIVKTQPKRTGEARGTLIPGWIIVHPDRCYPPHFLQASARKTNFKWAEASCSKCLARTVVLIRGSMNPQGVREIYFEQN